MNSDNETKTMPAPETPGKEPSGGRQLRRRPADKDKQEISFNNLIFLLFFPVCFIYWEFVTHLWIYGEMDSSFYVYTVLFSLSAGLLTGVICSLFTRKINYWVSIGVLSVTWVYFCLQLVYNSFFKDFFYWGLLEVGGNFATFWRETLNAILHNLIPILLLLIPIPLFVIFGRKIIKTYPITIPRKIIGVVLSVALMSGGIAFVNLHDGQFDDLYYYKEGFSMSQSVSRFGILTSLRLDTQYTLFGYGDDVNIDDITTGEVTTQDWSYLFGTTTQKSEETQAPSTEGGDETGTSGSTAPEETTEAPKPVDTSPNVMDIDFDTLIANSKTADEKSAHCWFSTREATLKNEYTGMFAGKNLIMITVESWAPAAIDPVLTPTLYKMKTEGFVFENYYCSNWGGSTNTGEYAVLTGNYFRRLALWSSSQTYQPFTLANQLKKLGYTCNGFHNGLYDYYDRNLSHPNFGYNWHGLTSNSGAGPYSGSNGWDCKLTGGWPTSDFEMAESTLSYIPSDGSPFHLYYMTISGHPSQTWTNVQAAKHKDYVLSLGLSYTESYALSYVACQYEVELMVSALVEELTEKGLLEDTVFVMAPDHYPYDICGDDTTNAKVLSQLYNIPTDDIFNNPDLYKAPLIIWCADMEEPVQVTKVCSAIDIVPTVSNLFGLEYDSRLIMGRDILSTSDGFVVLNTSNSGSTSSEYWITDYLTYNISTKKYVLREGVTIDETALTQSGYITTYNKLLENMNYYTQFFLYKYNNRYKMVDYYRLVFPDGE